MSAPRTAPRVPPWVFLPASIGVVFVLLAPLAVVLRMPWSDFLSSIFSGPSVDALRLSVVTAAVSTLSCLVLGVPMAIVFARMDGIVVRVIRALVLLPLVLPPVVGGLALIYALGRNGVVGQYLDQAGITIAFTTTAVVMSQTFVALPFLVLSVEGALRSSGGELEQVAATLGASPTRTLWKVTLPLMVPSLLAGTVLAFARALGEFGATITFAGNLPGTTQTAPLRIYLQSVNDPEQALPLGLILMVLALVVVITVHLRRNRTDAR